MQFTPTQQKTLSYSRHLAIVANAGSGKTGVLAARYVKILEENLELRPRNVLAITFTDAAAAELRGRIARIIDGRIGDTDLSLPTRRRMREIRSELSGAAISTIHAFARRALLQYPVEANVDAAFGTLQGTEQHLLAQECVERVIFRVLAAIFSDDGVDHEHPLFTLFVEHGRGPLQDLLLRMLNDRVVVEKLASFLDQGDEEVLNTWCDDALSTLAPVLTTDFADRVYAVVACLDDQKSRTKILNNLDLAYSEKDGFRRFHESLKALSSVRTKKGELSKRTFKAEAAEAAQPYLGRLNELLDPLSKVTEGVPATRDEFFEAHREYLVFLRSLKVLYDQALQEYTEAKSQFGVLDFDDQLGRLNTLLRNPAVREELAARYPFIMIDEYQDTDPTQFEIVKALTEDLRGLSNLAIVGDPKQSIYSFRNADVSLFNEAVRDISASNSSRPIGRGGDLTPDEESGVVKLQENFRILAKPLAFINEAFSEIMGPEDGITYDPLILGREGHCAGSVEWLLDCSAPPVEPQLGEESGEPESPDTANPDGPSLEDATDEAELIADKVQRILQGGIESYPIEEVQTDNESRSAFVTRAPKLSDIAILLRARTHLTSLQLALSRRGIPFSIAKGSGFYAQQEVLDAINYLGFLLDRNDDIALLGILRSPFFGVSDTKIFEIAFESMLASGATKERTSLWHRLQSYVNNHPESVSIQRVVQRLLAHSDLVGRIPNGKLVERIFDDALLFATIGAQPDGNNRCANLQKFLEMARQSDTRSFRATTLDFYQRLVYLREHDTNEPQADFSGEGDSVRILTVHGAKGLEYPIVIAGFLGQPFKPGGGKIYTKAIAPPGPTKELPWITQVYSDAARKRSMAEEKRILYVALTRARDHLIVSGSVKLTKEGQLPRTPTAMSWLLRAFDWQLGTESITVDSQLLRYADGAHTREPLSFEIPITSKLAGPVVPLSHPIFEEQIAIPPTYLVKYALTHTQARFSATQFLTHRECATKYYLQHILGLPEEPSLVQEHLEPAEHSERVRGAMYGQYLHKMLERIDALVRGGTLDVKAFLDNSLRVEQSIGILDETVATAMRSRARRDIDRLLHSTAWTMIERAAHHDEEVVFESSLAGRERLYGVIDRLMQFQDGTWCVLDYKTGSRTAERSERYRYQLLFYSALVTMNKGLDVVKASVYYADTGELESWTFLEADWSALLDEAVGTIRQIREEERLGLASVHRNNGHCSECHYATNQGLCIVPESKSQREPDQIADLVQTS